MMEREDVVAYLLERGLLPAGAVVDGAVRIVDASRRNRNYHVLPDGAAGLVVKQDSGLERMVGTVRNEALIYELFASTEEFALLRGRIPRCVDSDPHSGALITQFIASGENARQYHYGLGSTPVAVAGLIGQILGILHAAGREAFDAGRLDGLSRALPDAMELTLPPLAVLHGTSAGMQALIRALQHVDGVAEPMAQLVADWRLDTLVHGDPRWDNWVVGPQESVVLVDWEFARVGDPAWDVGAVLGEYVGAWVLGTPELPGSPLSDGMALSAFPLESLRPAMSALWDGYLEKARPFDPADELDRVVRCTAAKLVELSGEQMFGASDLNAPTGALIQLAAHIFAEPFRAAGSLLGLAVPTGV